MRSASRVERQQALRSELLRVASELLSREGPAGLSVRRLADAAGCSTMAIYTLYGGKDGLLDELFGQGFDALGAAAAASPRTDDPLRDLVSLAWLYRDYALAQPGYYEVMFGRPVPQFSPTPEARARSRATFGLLVDAVERCVHAGALAADDAVEAAFYLWSVVHGMVSLELAGFEPDQERARRRFAAAIDNSLLAYRRQGGGRA